MYFFNEQDALETHILHFSLKFPHTLTKLDICIDIIIKQKPMLIILHVLFVISVTPETITEEMFVQEYARYHKIQRLATSSMIYVTRDNDALYSGRFPISETYNPRKKLIIFKPFLNHFVY